MSYYDVIMSYYDKRYYEELLLFSFITAVASWCLILHISQESTRFLRDLAHSVGY